MNLKLHVGCGEKIIPGFVNIDLRPGKDIFVDDTRYLSSFQNNTISLIYACHILEHFSRYEYMNVLRRWYSLLETNGILRISVPNIQAVFEMYNQGYSLRKLWGFLYGGQNYEHNYHYVGFDYTTLKEDLENIGFVNITVWDWKTTEHSNIDDFSQAYIPHMDKTQGKLMSLNIQAYKP